MKNPPSRKELDDLRKKLGLTASQWVRKGEVEYKQARLSWKRLLEEHRTEIGAGLGPLAGQIWRVGLMGHTARPENVDRFLASLREALSS